MTTKTFLTIVIFAIIPLTETTENRHYIVDSHHEYESTNYKSYNDND